MPSLLSQIESVPVGSLEFYPGNPRRGNVEVIAASLAENEQYAPLVVQRSTRRVLAGNHTLKAAISLGWAEVDVVLVDVDDARARKILLSSNRTAEMADPETGERYDDRALAELLLALDGDYDGTGWGVHDLDDLADLLGRDEPGGSGGGSAGPDDRPSLADRFLIPPFDVLDTEQGAWRARKRQWLSLGLRSEEGRQRDDGEGGEALTFEGWTRRDPRYYDKKRAAEQRIGRELTTAEFEAEHYQPPESALAGGTSIFDPVLCELAYRWFAPPGGLVLDPFAGGSVRGLVAAMLGRRYIGNDLSERQVKANLGHADEFQQRGLITDAPAWSVGDSASWVTTLAPESADLLFTCPPYYDLERYSDDPADLSAMTHKAFDAALAVILKGASAALRPDRFAVIVTGDARDKRGCLHDLRGPTITAAHAAGLAYCSGAILVTTFGSLPMVVARAFKGTRTLGRRHQDVLVFCKGNRSAAAKACGDVDLHLPDEVTGAFGEEDPEGP